jgi:GDP-L-fucose synthase
VYRFYKNKKILVAGGTGVIGIPVVKLLSNLGSKILVVSQHNSNYAKKFLPKNIKFKKADLRLFSNCKKFTKNMDIVINLVGIKGSTGIGNSKVSDFFYSMIMFQTNLMHAAYLNKVKKFLFVSSICGYPFSNKEKKEEDFWNGLPKQNDMIPGIVKRLGEIQAEAFFKQENWKGLRILRPANVFGPHDDFNQKTGQVIPSLISKLFSNSKKLTVWGDGSARRDFVYSKDVARAILIILKDNKLIADPLNFGSGRTISIKLLVEKILKLSKVNKKIIWKKNAPTGDKIRLLSMKKFKTKIKRFKTTDIDDALKQTINWYKKQKKLHD